MWRVRVEDKRKERKWLRKSIIVCNGFRSPAVSFTLLLLLVNLTHSWTVVPRLRNAGGRAERGLHTKGCVSLWSVLTQPWGTDLNIPVPDNSRKIGVGWLDLGKTAEHDCLAINSALVPVTMLACPWCQRGWQALKVGSCGALQLPFVQF